MDQNNYYYCGLYSTLNEDHSSHLVYYSLVIPPLKMPFHGWRDLSCIHLSKMCSHHPSDSSIPGPQVQQSVRPPFRADPEQLLELLRGEDKHRAATQKPETESWSEEETQLDAAGHVCDTHPLMEVRDTSGLRKVDTKEW